MYRARTRHRSREEAVRPRSGRTARPTDESRVSAGPATSPVGLRRGDRTYERQRRIVVGIHRINVHVFKCNEGLHRLDIPTAARFTAAIDSALGAGPPVSATLFPDGRRLLARGAGLQLLKQLALVERVPIGNARVGSLAAFFNEV